MTRGYTWGNLCNDATEKPRRIVAGGSTSCAADRFNILIDFYREEFLKHRQCLEEQREYYSEGAITSVEVALTQILSQLDQLSAKENADQVMSRLLKKFNVVTGLSRSTDPRNVH